MYVYMHRLLFFIYIISYYIDSSCYTCSQPSYSLIPSMFKSEQVL
nr:MAG TPA: hypothetical protein [Bacteriophage sp.]